MLGDAIKMVGQALIAAALDALADRRARKDARKRERDETLKRWREDRRRERETD